MSRNYTKHTVETLAPIVASSTSYAECLNKLGLKPAGGNYKNIQRNILKFGLDTSHMSHQAHNEGYEFKDFDSLLSPTAIKKRLIKEHGHVCMGCASHTWCDVPIPLELEHKDGNNRNNNRDNVSLLCPNCHALTPTWRNRKR